MSDDPAQSLDDSGDTERHLNLGVQPALPEGAPAAAREPRKRKADEQLATREEWVVVDGPEGERLRRQQTAALRAILAQLYADRTR